MRTYYPKRIDRWDENHQLTTFTFPEKSDHANRKYKIIMFYRNPKKIMKSKKIYFGLPDFSTKVEG